MNKVVVKSLIGQNGESLGAYVDYGDFCQMQSEYEEQIEKMKNCNNCKYNRSSKKQNICIYSYCCNDCNKWELAE